MEKHIVSSYDDDLNLLRSSILNMMGLVKDLVSIANFAIDNPKKSYAQLADSTDSKINHFDETVEQLAVDLLALRQPMAVDLRHVISALRLAVILERMGDLAKKISHRIEYLPITPDAELMKIIQKTLSELERLIEDSCKAYDDLNDKLAIRLSEQDHIIDGYYTKMMLILEAEIEAKPEQAESLMRLILIARNLERIGDYINKIAKIIIFIATGKKPKHK